MKTSAVAITLSTLLLGCTSEDANTAAKAEFWEAFGAGDVAGVATARDHMIAAFATHGNDDETARCIGMSYGATDLQGGANAANNPNFLMDQQNMLMYLEKATTVTNDPARQVWNYTFYGGTLWGMATRTNDTATAQHASDLLDQSAAEYPIHGLYTISSVMAGSPAGSAAFRKALDAHFQALDICTGAPVDRTHPDVSGDLAGPFPDEVCGNQPKYPHNLQGELFKLGDMLVKNGQIDDARAVYTAIENSDGYATWQFQDLVAQRLSADLTQPLSAGISCFGCHQR